MKLRTALWRAYIIVACLISGLVLLLWRVFGLPLWACIALALVGVVANGIFAEWEDNQPGGFNNPDGKE